MAVIRNGTVKHNKRIYQLRQAKPEWEGMTVKVSEGMKGDGSDVSVRVGYDHLAYGDTSITNPPGFEEMGTGLQGRMLASLVLELKRMPLPKQIELLNSFRREAGDFSREAHDIAGILTTAYEIPWVYGWTDA